MAGVELICHAVRQHLLALQYGDAKRESGQEMSIHRIEKYHLEDSEWIRQIIVWLEDTKIRHYDLEDRKDLKSIDKCVWYGAVREYLRQLQYPMHSANRDQANVCPVDAHGQVISPNEFLWVLEYALGLAYDDGAETARGYDEFLAGKITKSEIHPCYHVGHGVILSDLYEKSSADSFEKLCNMLSIQRESKMVDISADSLSKCRYRLMHEIVPLLERKQEIIFPLNEDTNIKQTVPLGFSTGNDESDLAALVLRILHVKKLRRLQNIIDDMIVKHQDITANPRTDTGRRQKKKDQSKP